MLSVRTGCIFRTKTEGIFPSEVYTYIYIYIYVYALAERVEHGNIMYSGSSGLNATSCCHAAVYAYVCVCVCVCLCVCMYIYIYIHIDMYVCVCMYVYIYIHIHIHSYIQTFRYSDIHS